MKFHESLAIHLSIGESLGFLLSLLFTNYEIALSIYLSLLLINIIIFISGEYILGINKDIQKYNNNANVLEGEE